MGKTYTPETHPKMFASYGADFIENRIEPMIAKVWTAIAMRPDGGLCEYVECSQRTTLEAVVIFADLRDGRRLWFFEKAPHVAAVSRWDGPGGSLLPGEVAA